MMKRLTTTLFVLLTFALVAASCGDDDGGSDLNSGEQKLADAIAAQMLEDDDSTGDMPMTEADADCVAQGVVSEVGVDRLVEVGLSEDAIRSGTSPEDVDLPDEVIDDFVGVFMDCVDLAEIMVAGMTEDSEISDDSAECLAEGMLDDYEEFLTLAARSGITGEEFEPDDDPDLMAGIIILMSECLTPEELSEVVGG
jgi:hypothetical protein